MAAATGASLTVIAVAVIEPERRPGCCDLRSGMWNRIQREIAEELLLTVQRRLAPDVRATFALAEAESVEAAVVREADARGCHLVVVPDERRPLLPWNVTLADRLRRRSDRTVVTPGER